MNDHRMAAAAAAHRREVEQEVAELSAGLDMAGYDDEALRKLDDEGVYLYACPASHCITAEIMWGETPDPALEDEVITDVTAINMTRGTFMPWLDLKIHMANARAAAHEWWRCGFKAGTERVLEAVARVDPALRAAVEAELSAPAQ